MSVESETVPDFELLGVRISLISRLGVFDKIEQWANDDIGRYICVREFPGLLDAAKSDELLGVHTNASLVLPDGMPIVWLGRLLGYPVKKCSGPDLMPLVFDSGREMGLKHYLYGGNEGVAEELAQRLEERFLGVNIVGKECPPFRALTSEEVEATRCRIRSSGADVVWVGISSPKQDFWMKSNVSHLSCTIVGVGAAFDFHSGAKERAPVWMQRVGLEWVFRLVSEPKRLWRRYLFSIPKFITLTARLLVSRWHRIARHSLRK